MRDVSRHKSMDVLHSYVRDADLFRDHAGIGLLQEIAALNDHGLPTRAIENTPPT
jgi:hypothetical protein